MKKLITTTAMLMLFASIASAQEVNRTREYRMWSAERMIERIADKLVRLGRACDRAEWVIGQRLSEKCIANVLGTNPVLKTIREVAAADGDPVHWRKLIDAVHTFEAEIEEPLNTLERGGR